MKQTDSINRNKHEIDRLITIETDRFNRNKHETDRFQLIAINMIQFKHET